MQDLSIGPQSGQLSSGFTGVIQQVEQEFQQLEQQLEQEVEQLGGGQQGASPLNNLFGGGQDSGIGDIVGIVAGLLGG